MKITTQLPNLLPGRIDSIVELPGCGKQSTTELGKTWRRSIAWLASPAFRLHQYRNIHTQMLRGALCAVDCGNSGQEMKESRDE